MKKILNFILQAVLYLIALFLWLPIEIINFTVVTIKSFYKAIKQKDKSYLFSFLTYFENKGYAFDVLSSSAHRSLWNFLFVKEEGYKFKKNTKISISAMLGINKLKNTLKLTGKILYYILYAIDFTNWFDWKKLKSGIIKAFKEAKKRGHCIESIPEEKQN